MHATVTVTVMDGATVFEGSETSFRYDLTGASIADGSALEATVGHIKELSGGQWPDCTVGLVADPSGTDITRTALVMLMRHLRLEGVTVLSAGQLDDYSAPATEEFSPVAPSFAEPEPQEIQDTDDSDPLPPVRIVDSPTTKRRVEPFHILVAVVVVALIGVSLWAVGIFNRDTDVQAAPASAPPSTSASASTPSETTTQSEAPTTAQDTGVLLERNGLRFTLPQGFETTEDDGLITATGEDPNLRVLLAADPLYSVPAAALFAELREEIAEDPTLDSPEEADGTLTYIEQPGDDSQVTWTTWVADGHQMSVGCHSRQEPTRAHRAACRMAIDTLVKVQS